LNGNKRTEILISQLVTGFQPTQSLVARNKKYYICFTYKLFLVELTTWHIIGEMGEGKMGVGRMGAD